MPKHAKWRFTTESIEYLREGFASPFFAYHPALATVLNINYPEDKFEILVDLSIGDIDLDAQKISHLNGAKWIFKNPVLPGQGISTRIVRKARA